MRVIGVFNRDGGTFKTTDMEAFAARAREIFAAHGHDLDVRLVDGKSLMAELRRAAGEAELLLAGGGDGTISAAAGIAYKYGIPLGVVPAGTMNLFARSLGLPLKLEEALEAIATGEVVEIDIATANGRPFVHQFSVGIHPKLVKLRSSLSYKSRFGKMLASCRAALGVLARPPNFTAEVVTLRGIERRHTAGISISNNPFDEGHLPRADILDRGVLGVYIMKPLDARGLLKLAFGLARGKWKSLPEVIDKEAHDVTIRFPNRKAGAVAVIDGELIALRQQVDLSIHPGALKVVVPRVKARESATPGLLASA
ncbi:MAG TPA: diacylglycerol kinase family protein [Devosia sp.]|jgi:diacylglycerol kinase family enzyme|nr:diacylglycerol kinase family protein [Devosia sp.]